MRLGNEKTRIHARLSLCHPLWLYRLVGGTGFMNGAGKRPYPTLAGAVGCSFFVAFTSFAPALMCCYRVKRTENRKVWSGVKI